MKIALALIGMLIVLGAAVAFAVAAVLRGLSDKKSGDHLANALFYAVVAFLAGVFLLCLVPFARAHDSWISRGAFKNAAGEWCCGEGDCFVVPDDSVSRNAAGSFVLFGVETIPESEAMPSPDGAYWRCKRPDGSRRCFFAPPPGS